MFLEFIEVSNLEVWIELPFMSNRALEPITDLRTARRTMPVRRENHNAVRQSKEVIAQRVEKFFRQLLRLSRAQ